MRAFWDQLIFSRTIYNRAIKPWPGKAVLNQHNDMDEFVASYDKWPFIRVKGQPGAAAEGWDQTGNTLLAAIGKMTGPKKLIAFECYQGVLEEEVLAQLRARLSGTFYNTRDYFKDEASIQELVYPDVTDDAVFGYLTRLQLSDFFDKVKLEKLRKELEEVTGNIFLYGIGATLVCPSPGLLVYFDMPRWELQLRFRRDEVATLGSNDKTAKATLQYKQAFFVDWRVLDKHKRGLMGNWDFVVDTTLAGQPKIVTGNALNAALAQAVTQPFRLVPFFDPGPWGGQWMKKMFNLDKREQNYAWCFDCVPEENSLLLKFDEIIFETPSINLVFQQPEKLLGEAVQARFGDEFPIRFDFLDTMEGGNLSLQVHPTTEYARQHFGIQYTQDESYYMLDAGADACVYLGLRDSTVGSEMIDALREANRSGSEFPAEDYVTKWPVKKHDHILIPAGTVHCSGRNSMVLEISATPYIFTFKLYDWGRNGMDGKPRPINIEHGKHNINWGMTPSKTGKQLINAITPVSSGDGWREESTGLHRREFIETRRHWFTKTVTHYTNGIVNVLNLVEGDEVIVESPYGEFEPWIVHYAETFVVPANVTAYTITTHGRSRGQECATLKAFVRTNP
jgi:mannose-6-phosphate isomerase class I